MTVTIGCSVAFAASPDLPATLPRPLTLESALTFAAARNPALLRVSEQIREQEGVVVTATANRLPTLGTSAQYTRQEDSLLTSPLYEDNNWTVAVTARQVIYAGGGVRAQVRAQREQLEAARLAFTAAVNDTLLAVRRQFYDVLLARELIGVQEEALRVLENELANAKHRRTAGTGSDFDVLRAEVAVANARPALIRARNTYRTAQDQLRATLGASGADGEATDLGVEGTLVVPARSVALADALAAARAQRPELLRQERVVKAAEQGITAARSGYLPTVSASAGYQWTKSPLITATESHLEGWQGGLQATWSIFDGRATAGRVTQARSRVNQARIGVEELQLSVDVEVRRAHSALEEASELLRSSEKVVEQARESLRLSQARFQAGTATQLDVLTAQSQLTQARSNLAGAQHDYAVALATLSRAMGATAAASGA
ncbi:TolC family protein [Opitutus sp. ER46]|uniref:TolC family protein n=1 Tax=Opitutus sp. ER46 TaxID=2161864 RepID=UPI001304E2C9|nr:TolC family protein [Opitutus sp. ER46]